MKRFSVFKKKKSSLCMFAHNSINILLVSCSSKQSSFWLEDHLSPLNGDHWIFHLICPKSNYVRCWGRTPTFIPLINLINLSWVFLSVLHWPEQQFQLSRISWCAVGNCAVCRRFNLQLVQIRDILWKYVKIMTTFWTTIIINSTTLFTKS